MDYAGDPSSGKGGDHSKGRSGKPAMFMKPINVIVLPRSYHWRIDFLASYMGKSMPNRRDRGEILSKIQVQETRG